MKQHKRPVLNRTHRGLYEVSISVDGQRRSARIVDAGTGWIHLSTTSIHPVDPQVNLSIIHRGPRGGMLRLGATCLSAHQRGDMTLLRLRLDRVKATEEQEFMACFLEQSLGYPDAALIADTDTIVAITDDPRVEAERLSGRSAPSTRPRPLRSLSRFHRWSRLATTVNYDGYCWRNDVIQSTTIRRVSRDGRRLFLSWSGDEPEIWEQLKLEVDVGSLGDPKPVCLNATVVGTCRIDTDGQHLLIVRLTRVMGSVDQRLWFNALQRRRPTRTQPFHARPQVKSTDSSPRC